MLLKFCECLFLILISLLLWLFCEFSLDYFIEFRFLFFIVLLFLFLVFFVILFFLLSFGSEIFGSFILELMFLVIFLVIFFVMFIKFGNKFFLGWFGLLIGDDIIGLIDFGLFFSDFDRGEVLFDNLLSFFEDKFLGTWRLVNVFFCCFT